MGTRPETARKVLLYWMDVSVALVSVMYLTLIVAHAASGRMPVPKAVAAAGFLVAFSAMFPFVHREAYDTRPRPSVRLAVSGLFAAGTLALLPADPITSTPGWETIAVLWVSLAALYLSPAATAGLAAAVVVLSSAYVHLVTGKPWPGVLLSQAFSAALMVVFMRLWRWLWWTIREAHDSQEAKARLAVAEERLRFARDLHDLLGHSLAVISLKSELAAKLSAKDGGRAAAEMAEVRRLAGESLTEVSLAVDGYRTLDLDEELARVRAALEAAGARCEIDARADDLPPAARTLLAWAVREGATNVLKHSRARRCTITISGGVLEIRNDGVTEPADRTEPATEPAGRAQAMETARPTEHSEALGPARPDAPASVEPARPGSGLRGLAERMTTAGGSFSAAQEPGGEFLLRAAVRR